MAEKTSKRLAGVILAAGKGVRMRSERAKVLHELGGTPLIVRSLRSLLAAGVETVVVVVGHQAAQVEAVVTAAAPSSRLRFALQEPQRGTGDAVRQALSSLSDFPTADCVIAYGDMPKLSASTIAHLVAMHRTQGAALSVTTVQLEDGEESSFGRVIRDADGMIAAIVEARDATPEQLAIREVNAGLYVAELDFLRAELGRLEPNNAQGEYYLTDLVARARKTGRRVSGYRAENPWEFAGVNSREDLAMIESQLRKEVNRRLMAAGVTMIDPATAYIADQVEVGIDTVIGPNVQILGRSRIGKGVRIEGCAYLSNVVIGDNCHLKLGVRAEECVIGPDSEIGPFAHLRPGTQLEGHNRIGNFVETKKARIGHGSKASHLSYLGDTVIGRGTNIGCGVITVNYDGYEKHLTEIGDDCMIGCDSQLIAPVKVGNSAYIASGTTVTRDVPPGALAFSEHPQRERPGWTENWRKRHLHCQEKDKS